jgi:hypothetical protein
MVGYAKNLDGFFILKYEYGTIFTVNSKAKKSKALGLKKLNMKTWMLDILPNYRYLFVQLLFDISFLNIFDYLMM